MQHFARHVKTYVRIVVAGDIHLQQKHCCAQHSIFIQLKVTCTSAIHTKCIVALPLQQWLHERTTILRYPWEME